MDLVDIVKTAIRVSPSIRRAIISERVKKLSTNFFPTKLSSPVADGKKVGVDSQLSPLRIIP